MIHLLPPVQLITTSLLTKLRELAGSTKIGDHEIPLNTDFPYGILYFIEGGSLLGPPLGSEGETVNLPYQLSCVGSRRDQAQLLYDRARDWILGMEDGVYSTELTATPGWVLGGRMASAAASGLQVEGSTPNRIYTAPLRFTLQVTPE